tara:strand:+ start:724 stop:1239 length:516 start_codon:yes stop_codon:yes gene_type:complete
MSTFLTEQIFNKDIYINPVDLNIYLKENIHKKLINSIEKKCNEIGYVLENSIQIVNKSTGKFININGHNHIKYNITYKCKLLVPTIGEKINCYINDITDAGIIAYVKIKDYINEYDDNEFNNTPIICILPYSRFNNIKQLEIGKKLEIKITAIRQKYNQSNIQIIGSPLDV